MTTARHITRRAALAAVSVISVFALAACGSESGDKSGDAGKADASASTEASDSSGSSEESSAHNDADVMFSQMMIPHHQQAVEMAELAAKQAASKEVKDLAEKIKGAQAPEIETMSKWLTSWNKPIPKGMEDLEGMDHSGHGGGMPGMMGPEAMGKLEKSSGAAFDKSFLEMMIEHHEGAIDMAKTEKKAGEHGPSKDLADAIIKAQTTEITQMKKMLG